MRLFYVFGNGLGHLNRILSYIRLYQIPFDKCILITNSKYTDYLPKTMEIIVQPITFFKNKEEVLPWLKSQIALRKAITELVVDVYPSGFYGELAEIDTLEVKKTLLARLLKPHYFKRNTKSQLYDKLIVVEEGLNTSLYHAKEIEWINLPLDVNYNTKRLKLSMPFFLIMHSGPALEVEKLYNLAKTYRTNNEHIYIQTFSDLNNHISKEEENLTIIHKEKPYLDLLNNALKIFTGVGYNTFWSTEIYRNKQIMMPFMRGYDDQFMRKRMSYKK